MSTNLATRCPTCSTVFRVVPDQLRISDGWVRCGRCAEVFNAAQALLDASTGAPRHLPVGVAAATPDVYAALATDDSDDSGADSPFETTQVLFGDDAEADGPYVPEASEAERLAPTDARPDFGAIERADPVESIGTDAPDAPDSPDAPVRPVEPVEPVGPLLATDPDGGSASGDFHQGAGPLGPWEPLALPDPLAPLQPTETGEPIDSDESNDPTEPASPPEPPDPAPTFADFRATPSFVRRADRAEQWRRPGVRLALVAVALLAVLALAAQVAFVYRDLVAARFAVTRPALQQMCAVFGCSIGPARMIDELTVEASGLLRVAQTDGYRLSLTLRNRSGIALALPAVDLSLTDSQGKLLARRVLRPAELGANQTELGAGRELQLRATLQTATDPVAGYTIELFYP